MPFSVSNFGEVLSEFQKFLPGNIPKPIMFPLLLVTVSLGAILGFCVGSDTITQLWVQSTVWDKAVATLVAGLVFLLIAYALNTLQPSLERWFQGRQPLFKIFSTKEYHERWWDEQITNLTSIEELYQQVKESYDALVTRGEAPTQLPSYWKAARNLPRYHIVTNADIQPASASTAPVSKDCQ